MAEVCCFFDFPTWAFESDFYNCNCDKPYDLLTSHIKILYKIDGIKKVWCRRTRRGEILWRGRYEFVEIFVNPPQAIEDFAFYLYLWCFITVTDVGLLM